MSAGLHSSFRGSPLQFSLNQINGKKSSFVVKGKTDVQASFDFLLPLQRQQWFNRARFSRLGRGSINLSSGTLSSGNRFRINCTNEPFAKTKAFIKSFSPLWKEGLFLFRCSVFVAVISAVGVLVWYAQLKGRTFVEDRLLPSVCSTLSEYLQREIDVGKVKSVSPLGITLHSCSIGPHREEFSCGEVPAMKLRIRPLASLRRGKVVIDAVLSQPSVLVAQKEDYSWLGIPSSSENSTHRHHSTEEGIDYRTKARREAREKAASVWAMERFRAAKEAAEMGYIAHQHNPKSVLKDDMKDGSKHSTDTGKSGVFYCRDEKMHLRDHHCVDTGSGYGSKHADLEKSFGVKNPGRGLKFWSGSIRNIFRRKFKRDTHRKVLLESGYTAKQRILSRSAAAAVAYFRTLEVKGSSTDSCSKQGRGSSGGGCEDTGGEKIAENDEAASKTNATTVTIDGQHKFQYMSKLSTVNGKESTMQRSETADIQSAGDRIFAMVRNNKILKAASDNQFLDEGTHCSRQTNYKWFNNDGGFENENSFLLSPNIGWLEEHHSADYLLKNVDNLQDPVLETLESSSENICRCYQEYALEKFGTCTQILQSISFWPLSHKAWSYKFPVNVSKLLSDHFADEIQKLKSCFRIKSEDIAAELAEELNESHTEGIEKVLPVTLDSIYFTDGTLMLLGFGDREVRSDFLTTGS